MLEVDCRKCQNCVDNACKIYGAVTRKAVEACAKDGFKRYKKVNK